MYITMNFKNHKFCTEWTHLNQNEIYICWRTTQEIYANNSYLNDNTHIKRFIFKKIAENFSKNNFSEFSETIYVPTNLIDKEIR